ncbi:MAG: aminodeoxychorismate/anthranilate synthase component II [Coriobacteriales bacterium]|jgi:anthranilate synthase component 2|nr:aminodeoxychorismate/anthranilate synthase component II [Coriobacteriales bacterium]
MNILVDNYDSFTYNLYQMIGELDQEVVVIRNDELSVAQINALQPSRIIISPGPGHPKDAGICEQLISSMAGKVPILGVCLGHQALCESFGAQIILAPELFHGKASEVILQKNCKLFRGLPDTIMVARYHSLIADAKSVLAPLEIIARTKDNLVMAVKCCGLPAWAPLYGLQFHPESILTPQGMRILQNFILDD